MLEVGIRVVRGPDWKWGNQDNGEGHVGTIVEVGRPGSTSSPDKTVVVQWDMGSRTNYRVGYQEAYDLRIFDNAPAGVRHPNVICDGCNDHGISGMLWKCAPCFDFDLCTMCYMNDTHDLNHSFLRYDTASSVGVDLPPRLESPKLVSKGIFAGARVIRGPDWDWGNQDGGETVGKVGRVVDIRGWDHESGRSVANVIWSSGSTNVYRLGHKGKVDLKCVQASSAGSYYVNHLPILGMPTTTISRNSSSGLTKPISSKISYNFNVGDKVQVVHDILKLKDMQEGHGGWNPRMAEYVGKIGTVHRVTERGDIRVQYDSGIRWTFNPVVVKKITSYSVGDSVQVINDYEKVKELQKGHGEWIDVMKDVLGKTGVIVKIYADNDLRIDFGFSTWTMNPLTVKLVPNDGFESNNSMYANANRRDETTGPDPMSSMLPHLMDDMSLETTISIERFVHEAAQGRVETIKKMIPKIIPRLNQKGGGKTALQVAAHQGHMEILVLLVSAGANLDVADDEGDTALHYSAYGNQPPVMDFLLKGGALINAVNKQQRSPLHVAVGKQYVECVKVLLKYKCNINIQDFNGDTVLHDAINKAYGDVINCLINHPGIDFTLTNHRGFNVLHYAALKGNHYAVKKLLGKARQLVDVKKDDGFSALHLAAVNGHYTVVKSIIEDGQAEIDTKNNRKQTALTLAIVQGHCGIVELLVSKGAGVDSVDEVGMTPLHAVIIKHFYGQSEPQSSQPQAAQPKPIDELRKHENAPVTAEVFLHLISSGWSSVEGDTAAAALACFLAKAGADLNKRNNEGVTPVDLVRSDRLKEMLTFYSAESRTRNHTGSNGAIPDESTGTTQSSARKSAGPCAASGACSSGVAVSATFGSAVSSDNSKPSECVLCSDLTELISFEPCGHRIVCEECCVRMKKCVNCGDAIHRKLKRNGQQINASGRTTNVMNTSTERLRYLENKFAEIEEAYCCSICMERRRNVAFLCGHSACEKCADALANCHMCRTPITQKINLY